ncbi:hypothetical protein VST7929_02707 [Vibrio stylophorae]|uniref:DUF1145 domain-containing protein n=1 Tax=Vibrio stylophorae TaxID=659351 RepID=A0ABM8ZWN1_9VIBR|nr:DUF1145 domain-containing protein [Vibrio stylophorae]CAH0534751.1 hypothetical protein VST7929_02707 [Vibrio stylophorae]
MTTFFNWLAKLGMLAVWGLWSYNWFVPLEGLASAILTGMGFLVLVLHLLQVALAASAVKAMKQQMTAWDKLNVLLFGTFGLIDIRRKYLQMPNDNSVKAP